MSGPLLSILLYTIAALQLLTFLVERTNEIAANTNGFAVISYVNKSIANITSCDGIWSCSALACQVFYWEADYLRILPNGPSGDSCALQPWPWVSEYIEGKIALILISIGFIFQLLALFRANRTLMRILATACLISAYIFGYCWSGLLESLLGDYVPGQITNYYMASSALLLLVNGLNAMRGIKKRNHVKMMYKYNLYVKHTNQKLPYYFYLVYCKYYYAGRNRQT